MRTKTRIKPMSDKKRKAYVIYNKVKAEYLEAHPICEICEERTAGDIHHCNGRIGAMLYNTDFFMALCRRCHDWIHANGREAREKGYLI